jgi:hypothetical protein
MLVGNCVPWEEIESCCGAGHAGESDAFAEMSERAGNISGVDVGLDEVDAPLHPHHEIWVPHFPLS